MGYKNFRIVIFFRIIILVLALVLLMVATGYTEHQVSAFILALFVIYWIISLIRYVERTNKKLTQFLESIRYSDFSTSFSDKGKGKSFEALNHAFNEVITEFKKTRAEKEEHYNYLQTVVQHISIGIIAFKKDGTVDMFNNAVKRMLKVSNLKNIHELAVRGNDLPETLLALKAGDKTLIKLYVDEEMLQLSVYATEFRMHDEEFLLVSLQNIHTELEEKEIESWQKLIRVLTHEIMNSITPISSLASTVREMLVDEEQHQLKSLDLDKDDVESICNAVCTIQNRSQGLLNFVEIYRNLTRIPKPNFRYFRVKEVFDRAELLLKPRLDPLQIECLCRVIPPDLMLTADPDLIDQVIINLVLNAIDAVKEKENPQITLTAYTNKNGRIIFDVADNGTGIKPDIMDKIFMPFFTSKKEGSGIGLSLSRQIMHLHKGNISVKSIPGEGSVFTLAF